MPTVVLVDASLSMALQSVTDNTVHDHTPDYSDAKPPASVSASKMALANYSVFKFLDHLNDHAKMEHVALMQFSSVWKCLQNFTRSYNDVREAAEQLECEDLTSLYVGLAGAIQIIHEHWGTSVPCKLIVLTDGLMTITEEVKTLIQSIQFPFAYDLHVISMSGRNELTDQNNIVKLQSLIESLEGHLIISNSTPDFAVLDSIIKQHVYDMYHTYNGRLSCGNMSSVIQLFPAPPNIECDGDFIYHELEFPSELTIIGFLSITDIQSPPIISRHLVIPKIDFDQSMTTEETDPGKIPSFTVMLHGALKVEQSVAIIRIVDDWYGMVMSWSDSRKKSSLVLSVFKPGTDSIPWLGDLHKLGPQSPIDLPGATSQESGIPVLIQDKKSYTNSSSTLSWLRDSSLQSDVQKLLRYGRKLPDKTNIFYKELNRIHKAALSIGFTQLLPGLSQILERECQLLPSTANPAASMQLQHAAQQLNSKHVHDIDYIIQPM